MEVLLHIWATQTGLIYLLGLSEHPGSIDRALSPAVQVAWYLLLLAGGSSGLLASWMQSRPSLVEVGLRVEAGALSFLTGGVTLYVVAMFATNGWRALAAGTFVATYGIACLWRARQVWRTLRTPVVER